MQQRDKDRARIAEQTQAFLAKGGEIDVLDTNWESNPKAYMDGFAGVDSITTGF